MGKDDFFKKKRLSQEKRKHDYKRPRANSFLIVTEGKRTEPLYFNGIKKIIQEKSGGVIDVYESPVIEICGQGCSTGKLIEVTERIVKNAKVNYQNVWVVFDKDDFEDFDQAIKEGEKKGYKMAWSNQSFEYWLYLHFNYSDAALHRSEWNKKLDEIFKRYNLGTGKYQKNYDDIYQIVNRNAGVNAAIRKAKRRMESIELGRYKPSEVNPGTTVYKLLEELKRFIDK
ncbi:hypothetical protein M2454_002728 [Aequitasia blattaphilus]|uniref:RloB family protein n=1 Tax=Aequitasia blattaphilus TaxID=2949332 RepID=A0ABT1EBV3_9FIRM|nr:RloB family protein [Aequitasia blattaphilus]MCP1103293.1 RloB family protein [Aequitasia blattaphilus]MCR8615933.1 RloB family protein [Aequitasia blattaphilus]